MQTINAPKVTEESVKEKILNIDNEKIQSILLHCLSEKTLTIEKIDNECDIYNKKIKPKLENEKMSIFFSYLLSKNIKLPPSMLLIELESLETIEKAIELMEDSLEFIYPSKIIGNTDKYIKFASAKDPDEKELISRYFSEKYPIENIYAEYDSYLTIKNMKYSAEEVKEFVLSLIEK